MAYRQDVRERQRNRATKAGERWRGLLARRAEVVRKLAIGGPEAADTPERVKLYRAREEAKQLTYARAGVTESRFTERRIGPTLDLDDAPPNELARIAGIPVGRIVQLSAAGREPEGFATGFLVAPNLIITNHHVFASAEETRNCGIQFGYEKLNGVLAAGTIFPFDTSRFFYANEELDFAVVGVSPVAIGSGASLAQFKSLGLIPTTGKILVGQDVSIIQYPEGGPKKYGVRDNELLIAPTDADLFLQYTTDTLPGSSGSPAFNKDWEVVGLHHSGVPEMKDGQILTIDGTPWNNTMPDSDIHWVANEGVRVSVICKNLSAARVNPEYQPALAELVTTFGENFSRLPAVESHTEDTTMDGAKPGTLDSSGGISITVQGTANFYIGRTAAAVAQQPLLQAALPPPPALTVAVEKKLRFDPDYAHRPGYKPNFLGVNVPLPGMKAERMPQILKKNGAPLVLKYHHYSLVMNEERRFQMWSAVNVDYTPSKRRKEREEFGTDTWIPDPRIAGDLQIQDQELYAPAKKFDRGHIVRRDDTAWGETPEEEILANSDSFHFTNSTPQHEQFNRDAFGFHGLWGGLENQIKSQASNVGNKMSIFAGPILDDANDIDHDFGGGPVKVPRRFWKVVLVAEEADSPAPKLRAYGFILDQSEAITKFGLEEFGLGEFDTFQVTLATITDATGVTFDPLVMGADTLSTSPNERKSIRLESLKDLRVPALPAEAAIKVAQAYSGGSGATAS
jgi:endonuclease G, mitochondrial